VFVILMFSMRFMPPLPAPPAKELCSDLLSAAVERVREEGLDRADSIFEPVIARCEGSQGLARELAGIRFAQRQWKEAAALARVAVHQDPADRYAYDLLGTTLLLQDDIIGALRAWNHIGKPVISDVHAKNAGSGPGVAVGVDANGDAAWRLSGADLGVDRDTLLTPSRFQRARRRLDEIAAERHARTARFELRPNLDGTASLEASMVQLSLVPRDALNWGALAFVAAIDREATIVLRSPIGSSERCAATWRWWDNRPRLSLKCGLPPNSFLPGFWQIETSWERDTYSAPASSARTPLREGWTHNGLRTTNWLTGVWRYSIEIGFDSWNARLGLDPAADVRSALLPTSLLAAFSNRRTVSLAGELEHRAFDDRLSVASFFSKSIPVTGSPPFQSVAARVTARSSSAPRSWQYCAEGGIESVSDDAPLSLWPRSASLLQAPLLRAHPLLDGGSVSLNKASVFGRELLHGTVEARYWSNHRPLALSVALASFLDIGRAGRRPSPDFQGWEADLGAGIRLRLPGSERVFRVDFGYGLRDGAKAVTFGSMF
jgi:hypothetical protein